MDERSRYQQFEAQFLRQLRTRAEVLLHRGLPSDEVQVETVPDGVDDVRATLTRLQQHDRSLLDELPGTQAVQLRFKRRVLGVFRTTAARLRARVLVPLEPLLRGNTPGPVGREQVLDALARYELMPRSERPTAVALASPTGFTADARALVNASGPATLVLLGGREDGGWDLTLPDSLKRTAWAPLFELETQDERLKRLLYHLERSATQLETRGVTLDELSDALGLPASQVEGLIRQACRQDARLLTVMHDGKLHLCRSPLADKEDAMTLWSRIRKLLGLKPTAAERVKMLTAQRVQLEQQRHELDQRVDGLETEERKAVEQGAAAKSDAERKQVAGKLVRTRRELRRLRAQTNVLTQQIDIIGTHIHHQTLAQRGRQVELPKAEDLTREAAEAEQIMAELSANADLAANIEVGAESPMMAEEEAAIFAEFKQAAESAAPVEPQAEASPSEPERATPTQPAEPAAPPPPAPEKDRPAPPEVG